MRSGEVLWWLVVLVLVFWAVGVFGSKNNEITDYFRFCTQTVATPQDCTSWKTGETKYFVNETSQGVQFVDVSPIHWDTPFAFSGCTVADAQNWYCTNTGAGGGFGYQNGVVEDARPYSATGITEHIGAFKYWWYSLGL